MTPWVVTVTVIAYGAVMFLTATRAENREGLEALEKRWLLIYAMSIAVYFTGRSFHGSVGAAAREGWNYLPNHLGEAAGEANASKRYFLRRQDMIWCSPCMRRACSMPR
jgi:Na+/proline symporter